MHRETTYGCLNLLPRNSGFEPYTPRMPTSPGPLLQALTTLWDRLRTDVAELPPIRPTVSPGSRRQDHGPEQWTLDDDGTALGLVVTADVLQEGAEAVLETLLHDAAHLLNWVRGARDTATRGAYHNGVFLGAAEEVGLEWPPDATRGSTGFRDVRLTDDARRRYATDLKELERLIPVLLPYLQPPTSTRSRTDRVSLACGCSPPRKVRVGRTVAAQGPIVCGVCNEEFKPE